jgi:hypothetical protein
MASIQHCTGGPRKHNQTKDINNKEWKEGATHQQIGIWNVKHICLSIFKTEFCYFLKLYKVNCISSNLATKLRSVLKCFLNDLKSRNFRNI